MLKHIIVVLATVFNLQNQAFAENGQSYDLNKISPAFLSSLNIEQYQYFDYKCHHDTTPLDPEFIDSLSAEQKNHLLNSGILKPKDLIQWENIDIDGLELATCGTIDSQTPPTAEN